MNVHGGSKLSSSCECYRDLSVQMHRPFSVLVNDVGDADSWHDLQKIGCDALEKSPNSFLLDRPFSDIPDTGIGGRMQDRALGLKSSAKKIDGIDGARTKCARKRSNTTCSK